MNETRAFGAAMIAGAVAFVVTMGLHPSGGSLERIRDIASVVIGTHSLAIASLVCITIGFLGLTARLGASRFLAWSAMVTFAAGALAAICAAVLNGLALPALARHHEGSDPATLDTLRVVLGYNHALNASFARVFMIATTVATVLWSVAILRTRALPAWVGVVGALAGATATALVLFGAIGVDVHDFGLFIFAFAGWSIVVGAQLLRKVAPGAAV